MPAPLPQKLSKDTFKKMLSGRKTFLPKAVVKKLQEGGLKSLLYKPKVTRQQAIRALKFLRSEHMSPRPVDPTTQYRRAAKQQFEHDEEIRQADLSKRVKVDIRVDIEKEMEQQDAMRTSVLEEHKGKLEQKHRQGEIYRVEKEEEKRQRERQTLEQKRKKMLGPKGIDPKHPSLAEPPDMAIG